MLIRRGNLISQRIKFEFIVVSWSFGFHGLLSPIA